jgi:hypothetical protein
MFLVERRTSLFWIVHGQTRMSTSLQLLHGPVSGSPRSSTIGSDGWLLALQDPYNPGHLDTHPLVREYFGEQLRSQQTSAWKESNRRLFHYYQTLAPQLPNSFREMEPLFSAVIGLFREALNEVYLPRIQRGNAHFGANVLGATGPLLSVLVYFFEHGRWDSPVEMGAEGQSLTAEDQLFILMQAAKYLTATRGLAAPEARICYERAEPLCHSLGRPLLLYVPLIGQWRYRLQTDKMPAAMQIAERLYSLAQEQNDAALMLGAYLRLLAVGKAPPDLISYLPKTTSRLAPNRAPYRGLQNSNRPVRRGL